MKGFVPYEKLSKKEKKALNTAKRATWGNLSPVTRKPENPKGYNRRTEQRLAKKDPGVVLFCPDIGRGYISSTITVPVVL
ncbi:MAG: hypothetical protein FWF69_06935 [Firmicutes bacterium]|nr:hypothetical protein [Bacillota bacterium]